MAALRTRLAVALGAGALVALAIVALSPRTHRASANPLTGIASVSAGANHTCALTTTGGVKCWGAGNFGQLGNGATATQLSPVDVTGLASGVAAISVGLDHTCALTTAGGVKCWGRNLNGELGDGTTVNSATPLDVVGLTTGVAAISAGHDHACALTAAGGVKCWGKNTYGELGNGTVSSGGCYCITAPVQVSGLISGAAAVSAGGARTCALTTAGGAKCWGSAPTGDGTYTGQTTPTDVSGLASGVAAVSAGGSQACALTVAGGVKCWGDNGTGEVGDGTLTTRTAPVDVSGLTSGVVTLSAGGAHTCVVTASGGVKCWGRNDFGQLGDGTSAVRTMPVDVSGLISGAASVSAGDAHTCALTTAGGVRCWGYNGFGGLGDGTQTHRLTPVDVVLTGPKPTPTSTPCQPSGCPTATPTATPPPRGGIDFSIGIDSNSDGHDDCSTSGGPSKCSISSGSTFRLKVYLNSLPANLPGYQDVDIHVTYTGVGSKNTVSNLSWPDCALPAQALQPGSLLWGCAEGFAPLSTYVGLVGTADFNCLSGGTVTMVHGPADTSVTYASDYPPDVYAEPTGSTETLTINCPTPTPHSLALGGVAEYPDVSSAPSATLLALIVTAAALAVAGVAWRFAARR